MRYHVTKRNLQTIILSYYVDNSSENTMLREERRLGLKLGYRAYTLPNFTMVGGFAQHYLSNYFTRARYLYRYERRAPLKVRSDTLCEAGKQLICSSTSSQPLLRQSCLQDSFFKMNLRSTFVHVTRAMSNFFKTKAKPRLD